jgi:hypothetical protein
MYRKYGFFKRIFFTLSNYLLIILCIWSKEYALDQDKSLSRPVNSELRLSNSRTKPGKSAAKRNRFFLLWPALILLSFIPAFLLTSLGQTLLTTDRDAIVGSTIQRLLIDNPVFNPLTRSSRSGNTQVFSGAHVIYNGDAMSTPSISWSGRSKAEWWVAADEDTAIETDPILAAFGSASPGKSVNQDSHPRLIAKTADPPFLFQETISTGVADLFNFLHEKDLKRQFDQVQGASKVNPFEEALKKVSHEGAPGKSQESASAAQTPANNKESTEPKPAAEDTNKGNRASEPATNAGEDTGTPPAGLGTFLVIGAFNDQLVATDIGTAMLYQFHGSSDHAIAFDLAGAGKKTFDMNIILRNRAHQESVATGDLNLDGFADMVITNKSTNSAIIYLNDKQGNYIPTAEIDGFGPGVAVIGDFNGDNSQDIAVLFQTDKTIVVNGKGYRQFILPHSPIDDGYSSMIPYDFSGDGLKDLLLTNYGNLASTLYTNLGNGMFAASGSFTLPVIQSSVDLNSDGISDLVSVQYIGDHISIVIQNGRDGSIHCLGNMMLDPSLYYVVGDFNQDGVVDIAISRPN